MLKDVKFKVAMMQFLGEFMSNPGRFISEVEFEMRDVGQAIEGSFKATGRMAEFLRESGNVQRALEVRNKIKA